MDKKRLLKGLIFGMLTMFVLLMTSCGREEEMEEEKKSPLPEYTEKEEYDWKNPSYNRAFTLSRTK